MFSLRVRTEFCLNLVMEFLYQHGSDFKCKNDSFISSTCLHWKPWTKHPCTALNISTDSFIIIHKFRHKIITYYWTLVWFLEWHWILLMCIKVVCFSHNIFQLRCWKWLEPYNLSYHSLGNVSHKAVSHTAVLCFFVACFRQVPSIFLFFC